jgi:hypothetical protein
MAILGRFLSDSEKHYLEEREKTVAELNPALLADNPFLFANRFVVTEMLVRTKLFEKIQNVSGAIVECGVAGGNNLMLFSHMSSIMEPYAINRRIIGFDTFAGFRSISPEDPDDISESDFSGNRAETIQKAIDLYDANRAVGHMKRTEIIKGDAVETIPAYVESAPELTIALLYLDFDLYEPTKVALEQMLPLVAKGGIVCLDEFNYDKFAGETQALKDVLNVSKLKLKRFPFAPFVAYFKV